MYYSVLVIDKKPLAESNRAKVGTWEARILEPAQMLTANELRQRVYGYFGCEQVELLKQQIS